MNTTRPGEVFIIMLSFFLAMVLSIIPLSSAIPPVLGYLRPDWVALILMWWVIVMPQKVGLLTAWILGLMMDVLLDTMLGQHALALVVIAYLTISFHQQLRLFSIWQLVMVVFAMLLLNQVINGGIEAITGPVLRWSMWNLLPALSGALIWPLVYLIFHSLPRWDPLN